MSQALEVPDGFIRIPHGPATLLADARHADALAGEGLADPKRWRALLETSGGGRGRGVTVVCRTPSGLAVRLKQMRRGGLTAVLWRDRFAGVARLLDNLRVPRLAIERDVPTPAALALLLLPGPPGFYRAWLAVEEIGATTDMAALLGGATPPGPPEWAAAMDAVRRMHDAGIEHPDLNLGNLLVRPPDGGKLAGFVIDLDAARVHATPLDFRRRQAALRRIERSYVKLGGEQRQPEGRAWIYESYAAGDAAMATRLDHGRQVGRFSVFLHRLGRRR